MAEQRKVIIVRNPWKPEAETILAELAERIGRVARVTGVGTIAQTGELLAGGADRIIVLGGDGSILAVARFIDGSQVPVAGVNFGKLGYLAEYNLDDVKQHLNAILHDPSIISRRMMIRAVVSGSDGEPMEAVAVNDCVIHAGPPYRMVELSILIDGEQITTLVGDGLVLSTPTGSTAHNMSAGGPIVHSEVSAIVLTPLSPHSLTHRPLVVAGDSTITVIARQVNEGTTIAVDGQISMPLKTSDELVIRRHERAFLLLRNPSRTPWDTLTTKLKWGQ